MATFTQDLSDAFIERMGWDGMGWDGVVWCGVVTVSAKNTVVK